MNTTTKLLHGFSPLAPVFLKNLGLKDKNGNGTIDKGAGEGYEQFVAKYGDADVGYATGAGYSYGGEDGSLDEKEIEDFYYRSIRFVKSEETQVIEQTLAAEIHQAGIPLLWLDDSNQTVLTEVKMALKKEGIVWPEQPVSLAEATELLQKTITALHMSWQIPEGANRTLSDIVSQKKADCFEISQFGFWFFSQLQFRSIPSSVRLTESFLHQVLLLPDTGCRIDSTGVISAYTINSALWMEKNPIENIGEYYSALAELPDNRDTVRERDYLERSLQYEKHNTDNIVLLMYVYLNPPDKTGPRYQDVIALGKYLLSRTDLEKIASGKTPSVLREKHNAGVVISYLLKSYGLLHDRDGFDKMTVLAKKYFNADSQVKKNIEQYNF